MCIAAKVSYKIRQETVCYNLKCVYKSYWVTLPSQDYGEENGKTKYTSMWPRGPEEKQDNKSKSVT